MQARFSRDAKSELACQIQTPVIEKMQLLIVIKLEFDKRKNSRFKKLISSQEMINFA